MRVLLVGLRPSRLTAKKPFASEAVRPFGEPCVIEPIETLLDRPEARHSPGTAAALPSIARIARFMSDVLPHDAENITSVLQVIWFQDDFALPIDPYVLSQFAVID